MTSMPSEIREVYEPLEQEIVWLHVKWQFYRQLFGADEERIELLNDIAPFLFRVCQDVLLDDVIISISRLTGQPRTRNRHSTRESLSLLRLVFLIDPSQHPQLRPAAQRKWKRVDSLCKPFRQHRHRRVAHTDLETIKATGDLLPGISRSMIEDALESIRELMNTVCEHFDKTTNTYLLVPPAGIDGDVLIGHLRKLREYYACNNHAH
jgi:hypothetical protein